MRRFTAKLRSLFVPLFVSLSAPAGKYDLLVMELVGPVAKWAASIGGVTVAVALSFSASAYVSFIQVYSSCQVQGMASNAVMGGQYFAVKAIIEAVIVLTGSALIHLFKLIWYSSHLQKAHKQGIQEPNLDQWYPTILIARAHSALIVIGTCVVLAIPLTALLVASAQTPEALAGYAKAVDARCANAKRT